jgi:hypothetical protein
MVSIPLLVMPLGDRNRIAGYDPTIVLPIPEAIGTGMDFEVGAGSPQHTETEILDGLFAGNLAWRQGNRYRVVHGLLHNHWPKQPDVLRNVDPYLGPNGEAPVFWLVVLHSWRSGSCIFSLPDGDRLEDYPGPHEAPIEYVTLIPDATGRSDSAMWRCLREKTK